MFLMKQAKCQIKNYVYPIGSVTKTFVASLLSKYVHEEKMSLDDSISKYIGGLDKGRYYPTLKRLATHTSGYAKGLSAKSIMAVVDAIKQEFGTGGGLQSIQFNFGKNDTHSP